MAAQSQQSAHRQANWTGAYDHYVALTLASHVRARSRRRMVAHLRPASPPGGVDDAHAVQTGASPWRPKATATPFPVFIMLISLSAVCGGGCRLSRDSTQLIMLNYLAVSDTAAVLHRLDRVSARRSRSRQQGASASPARSPF